MRLHTVTDADRRASQPILGPQADVAQDDHPVLQLLARHRIHALSTAAADWPLRGKVWTRENTGEKVLEIVGVIGDTHMTVRHTEPLATPDEAVPGLPDTYAREDALVSALERLQRNFDLLLAGKPVRDVAETRAEVDAALKPFSLEGIS